MARPDEHGKVELPMVEVEARMAKLKHDTREYEFRYELSSDRMKLRLDEGRERRTKDVLNWMSVFDSLQSLQSKYPHISVETPIPAIERAVDLDGEKMPDKGNFDARLRRSIAEFEAIYEMESQEMLELLSDFKVRETAELIKWMFDYNAISRIEEADRDSEGNIIRREATEAEIEESIVEFKDRVRDHEARFNVSSEVMLEQVAKGQISETVEITEWKLDLREVQLLEEAIHTTGRPGTAIEQFTKLD